MNIMSKLAALALGKATKKYTKPRHHNNAFSRSKLRRLRCGTFRPVKPFNHQ